MIWLIQHLPDWMLMPAIYGCLVLGLVGFVIATLLKSVPVINIHRRPIQLVSVCALTLGVWAQGAYDIEKTWRTRVAELESQVQAAEQRAKKINTQVVHRVVTRVKNHTVYRDRVREQIKIQREYIDRDCKLNARAVELYNQAIQGDTRESQ